ncbi:phage tail family protein [Staphylococcus hominis]|uniref:phage tail family protein n=1 Tax=Staphylococcus hominis TaxID=1290 RepID=UPI002878B914|nr:phage tail family protein [Staphylococcus hominis]MDS3866850.1 phage tail family protein [Staphylococcus hominis]
MKVGFKLYDPNMNEIKFPVGLKPLDFLVSSIEKERYIENVEGIPGSINYGFDYKDRGDCTLSFWLRHFHDEHDYLLLESEINELLDSQPYFYISRNNLPTRVLKIVIDSSYKPERILGSMYATLEVNATVIGLPFWQTKYTTEKIEAKGYDAIYERFGMGDGINIDYPNYLFKENTIYIWNGGNVTVDPRNMSLKFELSNVTSDGNFTISNETTSEKFVYKEAIASKKLTIDGTKVLINTTNKLRDSNRKFISLVPGLNKLTISNGTFGYILVDFPFYYK